MYFQKTFNTGFVPTGFLCFFIKFKLFHFLFISIHLKKAEQSSGLVELNINWKSSYAPGVAKKERKYPKVRSQWEFSTWYAS